MSNTRKAYRAAILHSLADPAVVGVEQSYQYFEDGILLIENGKVAQIGAAAELLPKLAGVEVQHYRDALITPGFIDTHIHYPQTGMIASYGEQLLDWLNTYTFPTEQQFKDKAHASDVAAIFLKELLRNGTTTALVFGSVHPQSVDAFFEQADKLNLRMIAGKVLMDRPGLPDRHRRIRLCREQGADRALAWQGPPALCGHPALRPHQHTGATGAGRQAAG